MTDCVLRDNLKILKILRFSVIVKLFQILSLVDFEILNICSKGESSSYIRKVKQTLLGDARRCTAG